jgi:hypothetical protein
LSDKPSRQDLPDDQQQDANPSQSAQDELFLLHLFSPIDRFDRMMGGQFSGGGRDVKAVRSKEEGDFSAKLRANHLAWVAH